MSDTGHLKCPRCGKELPPSAPEGLCPSCLGALNFATETNLSGADLKEALTPMTPAELAPHFPQLEILECLGRGGMGVVYKARQKSLNRLVALKLLAPERVQDAKFAERFEKEAHALAALNHPNIVTVHDFGQAGGFYFLLMEFVDGVNLRQLLRSRKLQPAEALAIVPPVCEALQYAHEHGIVHRDIKPENLLLAKEGRVKIADFGIAKMLGEGPLSAEARPATGGEGEETQAGVSDATQQTTMGTPQYMAPEQREQPQAADHRADIYSLGVVLYELLTGELPADKLQPPSSRVRGVQIDVRLDEIVLRALEKTPELRYQTAGEFKTQVETVANQREAAKTSAPSGTKTKPLLKAGRCYLTTRDKLGTFQGQMFLYRERYEMVLDDRQLAFLGGGKETTIPLANIRDVSLGRFPAAVNPAGLDFISITYEEGGQNHELIFAPCESLFGTPGNFNAHVGEWFASIRTAVELATGKLPGSEQKRPAQEDITPAKSGPMPRELKVIAGWMMVQGGLALVNSIFAFISWGQIFLNLLVLHLLIGFGLLSLKAGWWRAAVAMNGIQLFASLVGVPLALFAGATDAKVLSWGEAFRGQPVVVGALVLIQCVVVITCALVHFTLMRLRREGWFAAVPSKHGTAAFPVAVVVFYAGVILGILFIGMLSFRFSRDSAYLLVVGIMAVVSPFVGVMTGNALRRAEQSKDQGGLARIKGRLKALSVVAWILAVPVVGFAVFFFMGMLSERGSWNPATSEAVLVPLTWLGAVLLPWAGMRLWRAASQAGIDFQPKKTDGKGVFLWVAGALLVVFLLAGLALLSSNARRVAEAQSAARAAAERGARRGIEEGMVRTNHAPASQTTSNLVSAPDRSVASTHTVVVPTKFAFPVWLILGVLLLGGLFIGGVVLMVWLARKNGVKGCLVGGLVVGAVMLAVGLLVVLTYWGSSVREIRQGFQPISTLELSSINPNSPPATPNGLAMQVQNGFNLKVPPGQLVTFEVFIRHGDDRREPVPSLTAVVATDEGDGINTWLSWMGKREDDGQGTNQLWSWSVNGNVLGAVPMPNRTDYGTNMAWHVKPREILNWWQLAMPKKLEMNSGSIQEIALFRTFGSATVDPAQPKEIIARIKRHALPEEMKMAVGQYQMLLGLEAYEKVDAWNAKAGIGEKRTPEGKAALRLMDSSKDSVPMAAGQDRPPPELFGLATLSQANEQKGEWLWWANKQRPARILYGIVESDLESGAVKVVSTFSMENDQSDYPGWEQDKSISLKLGKAAPYISLTVGEKTMESPRAIPLRGGGANRPQINLVSWRLLAAQTQPVTLGSTYYQTLWEAEAVKYSLSREALPATRFRLVARLANPDTEMDFKMMSENDPVREVRPIGANVRGPESETPKGWQILSVTNISGMAVNVMSASALEPGEVIQPMVRFEDGRAKSGGLTYYVTTRSDSTPYDRFSLSWQTHPTLAPELNDAAVRQIKDRTQGTNVILVSGRVTRLFTVTNAQGVLIHGEINYQRSTPIKGDAKPMASLKIRNVEDRFGSVNLRLDGSVPENCKLISRVQVSANFSGEASVYLNRYLFSLNGGNASWNLRANLFQRFNLPKRPSGEDLRAEILKANDPRESQEMMEEAARQITERTVRGLRIEEGQSFEMFAVTNKTGGFFKGYLELVGNKP